MAIPAWLWFLFAVLAIAAGIGLLIADRNHNSPSNRHRRRWAELRGWQYAEVDQVLPSRWEHGVFGAYPGSTAADVVAGSTFTTDGRRQVYTLDLQSNSRTVATVAAVRCRRKTPTTVELWLPDVPVPQDSGLDLLGPIGSRYAFVADVASARSMLSDELVEAAEELGTDVTVTWFEGDWVLASGEPNSDPTQLEALLRTLGELADLVDPFDFEEEDHELEESASSS